MVREKREMEMDVVVGEGEEGSIFFVWGLVFGDGGRGYLLVLLVLVLLFLV